LSIPANLAHSRMTHQATFSVMPSPQTCPVLVTQRKMSPASTPAMASQASIDDFAHAETGTVRTWPPLPNRSMIAQWSSRCWRWLTLSRVTSDRHRPQPRSTANITRSRLPFTEVRSGAFRSLFPGIGVSQLPSRIPRRLAPFTRRMLAARSGLSNPLSDASEATPEAEIWTTVMTPVGGCSPATPRWSVSRS